MLRRRRNARRDYGASSAAILSDCDGDEAEYRPSTERRPKKRQRTKGATQVKQKARGLLAWILEIPMDVLFEVFKHLDPNDLLRLSRVNKTFRNIFTKKSSSYLWKHARDNIGLPDGPPDLSEPRYAKVMFDLHCDYCHKSVTRNIMWQNYSRLCKHCIVDREKFTKRNDLSSYIPFEPYRVVPSVNGGGGRWDEYYCLRTFNALKEEFGTLSMDAIAERRWEREKKRQNDLRSEHGKRCMAWIKAQADKRKSARDELCEARFEAILDKLCELGWSEEVERLSVDEITSLKFHDAVWKVDELTEDSWEDVAPAATRMMQRVRIRRQGQIGREIRSNRRGFLTDAYAEYIKSQSSSEILPGLADVALAPEFITLVNSPLEDNITTATFKTALQKYFSQITERWRESLDNKLLSSIRHKYFGQFPETQLSDLSRPTTIFHCAQCIGPRKNFHYPEILEHSCLRRGKGSSSLKEGGEIISGFTGEAPIHVDIGYDHPLHGRAAKLLKGCGVDPDTISLHELDAPTMIFECKKCYEVGAPKPRALMQWRAAIKHISKHTKTKMCRAELTTQELHLVTGLLADALREEKESFLFYQKFWVCVLCRERFNQRDLHRHMRDSHDKHGAPVEDKDYTLHSDAPVGHNIVRI